MKPRRLKLLNIITGLGTGGAEIMLYRLLGAIDLDVFDVSVVSLTDVGAIGRKIEDRGFPVRALGLEAAAPNPLRALQLAAWIRELSPTVIQTWMHHADLLGGLAAKVSGGVPVAWGIHQGVFDPERTRRRTMWAARTSGRFSNWLPARIVCCSETSRRVHAELGYVDERMRVIPNGFDLDLFRPDPEARRSVRHELELADDALLIGLFGRFHPWKNHHSFVRAAARLAERYPDAHYVMCGDGIDFGNAELAGWIDRTGLRSRFRLLGPRDDIPRLTASLDIASSASLVEAFPLVVGEAMASGVPCVATDVGDSAAMLADTGVTVTSDDPSALAAGWQYVLRLRPVERTALGLRARRRVEENYSLTAITARYEALYWEMAEERKRR